MKYLFFDYDGTLTHNGVISEKNKEYLARAQKAGHKIFLNTGRSKGNMPENALSDINWDGMICGGGYMEYEGRVLFETDLDEKILTKALKYAEDKGVSVLFEGVERVYVNRNEEGCENIYDHLPFSPELRITNITVGAKLPKEDKDLFSDASVCVLPTYFEIMKKGVSKSSGLKYIEENLGIDHGDIIVFGDSENDIEMLKYAKTSVIMNHAPKTLDAYATLRTESSENGVAEGLIKLLDI
ncbi:MAG: HAD family hydrolase [Clostridia bacterium]|nr:HAD family hydrolase [Clostridia bacterium]